MDNMVYWLKTMPLSIAVELLTRKANDGDTVPLQIARLHDVEPVHQISRFVQENCDEQGMSYDHSVTRSQGLHEGIGYF